VKVKKLMFAEPVFCDSETDLASVAHLLWENDCGSVPVVAHDHKVIGMITDRDICMAAATKHRPPGEITVAEVIDGNVYKCQLDTDLGEAMLIMKQEQVRRLPVVDADGKLQGVLSLADIILSAEPHSAKAVKLSAGPIMEMLKAICSPRIVSAAEPQRVQGKGA
jgi:CBS domain-containing protein